MSEFEIYTKGQVNAAGLCIRDHATPFTPEFSSALDVLGSWRTTHVHPLQTVYMALRERARRCDSRAIASQRLKRVPSIVTKLQRNHNMKLTTMQDIGGCRAVLADVPAVRKLAKKYHTVVRDYISEPKVDGYRSIHLVEEYQPITERHEQHAGRRIEVQLRTALQHAWATAVETVDSLLGENLKVGRGQEEWKRFFVLASAVIARREGCPLVPGSPESEVELKDEIRAVAERLDVFARLDGLASTVENLPVDKAHRKVAAYVLRVDLDRRIITPRAFGERQLDDAAAFYLQLEKEHYGDPKIQIVQVSVNQVRDLKRAFPNYYLNATAFLKAISGFI